MKLVVCFSVGDGCTYSCDETIPCEHESDVALLCEYEDAVKAAVADQKWEVHFLDNNWSLDIFYDRETKTITEIEIYELEVWFQKHKVT